MEILELKSTTETRNLPDGFNSTFELAEEIIRKLEDSLCNLKNTNREKK